MIVNPIARLFSRAAAKPIVKKAVKTMAKNAASEGIQVGKEVISSILEGSDWKESLKRNSSQRGKKAVSKSISEIKQAIADSNPSKSRSKKKTASTMKKRGGPKKRARKAYYNDIFG